MGRVREATVVAYYDALPADLADLVGRVQGWVGQELAGFEPWNPQLDLDGA
jgi:hypothetical protein